MVGSIDSRASALRWGKGRPLRLAESYVGARNELILGPSSPASVRLQALG